MHFLDMEIVQSKPGVSQISMYDKRDHMATLAEYRRYPHVETRLSQSCIYATLHCQLCRFATRCTEIFRFFVAPTLRAPCGVLASARLCCLSRVPPAVCPSLLESATTTVCTSFLQSLSTYVHTPTPHSVLRFRPAPQTPDLHTSNLPLPNSGSKID